MVRPSYLQASYVAISRILARRRDDDNDSRRIRLSTIKKEVRKVARACGHSFSEARINACLTEAILLAALADLLCLEESTPVSGKRGIKSVIVLPKFDALDLSFGSIEQRVRQAQKISKGARRTKAQLLFDNNDLRQDRKLCREQHGPLTPTPSSTSQRYRTATPDLETPVPTPPSKDRKGRGKAEAPTPGPSQPAAGPSRPRPEDDDMDVDEPPSPSIPISRPRALSPPSTPARASGAVPYPTPTSIPAKNRLAGLRFRRHAGTDARARSEPLRGRSASPSPDALMLPLSLPTNRAYQQAEVQTSAAPEISEDELERLRAIASEHAGCPETLRLLQQKCQAAEELVEATDAHIEMFWKSHCARRGV